MQNTQLFQQYESLKKEKDLLELIKEGVREGLHYEYKRKTDPTKPDLSEFDKKNLSKTISSFANSDGGILIWGVLTFEKGDTKLPEKLETIEDVYEFEKRLNNYLPEGIQLQVENLMSDIIHSDNSKTSGYVKYYVPPSDLTPHRSSSKDAEYDHYYARNSEGCYRMPHYQVSDMFGRRQKPDLVLSVNAKKNIIDNTEVMDVDFAFKNEGRAMAKYYGYLCKFEDGIEIIRVSEVENVSHLNDSPTISYTNNVGVIHPNGITYNAGNVRIKKINKSKIKAVITYFCENMVAKTKNLEIGEVGI